MNSVFSIMRRRTPPVSTAITARLPALAPSRGLVVFRRWSALALAPALALAFGTGPAIADEVPVWSLVDANPLSPSNGEFPAAAYDTRRRQLVYFNPVYSDPRVYSLNLSFAPPTWELATPAGTAPSTVYGQSMVYDSENDRLLLFGGRKTNGLPTNELFQLSRGTSPGWTRIFPAGPPPPARANHTAVFDSANRRMLVFGGDSLDSPFNDVWALPVVGPPVWQPILAAGAPPGARTGTQAVYDPVQQRLLLFGGFANPSFQDDVWSLSLDENPTWQQIPVGGSGPAARRDHSLVFDPVGYRLILCGGRLSNGTSPVGDVWAFDLGASTWQQLSAGAPQFRARYGHSAIYDPDGAQMVVCGGGSGGGRETWGFPLNPDGAWTPLVMRLSPVSGSAAVYDSLHRQVLLFGGDEAGRVMDQTWSLPLGEPALRWTRVFPGGSTPPARESHVAAWDTARNRMLVFGGQGFGVGANELWAFTPAPPAWSPVVTNGTLPGAARVNAGLVYDAPRDRLVLFGGNNQDAATYVLPFGGHGAPKWSALTTSGTPPAARHGHTMIYDPVREWAILMGGVYDPSLVDPPTVYDELWVLALGDVPPAWTPLSLSPRPAMRFGHSAACDSGGDGMLVFGGINTLIPTAYGDAQGLSLATQAWSALQPVGGPPDPRFEAAAVMDPVARRLVLYGGQDAAGMVWNDTWVLDWVSSTAVEPGGPTPAVPRIARASFDRALRRLRVALDLAEGAPARLDVLDLAGRRVAGLDLNASGPGQRELSIEAAELRSGIYFVRAQQSGKRAHAKVVVLR